MIPQLNGLKEGSKMHADNSLSFKDGTIVIKKSIRPLPVLKPANALPHPLEKDPQKVCVREDESEDRSFTSSELKKLNSNILMCQKTELQSYLPQISLLEPVAEISEVEEYQLRKLIRAMQDVFQNSDFKNILLKYEDEVKNFQSFTSSLVFIKEKVQALLMKIAK